MIFPFWKIAKQIFFLSLLLSIFSCNKDSDLFTDYVITENNDTNILGVLLINDSYTIKGEQSINLDVLNNDTFVNSENVEIINTSTPKSGSVIINTNNTLTYNPKQNVQLEDDSFTYTVRTEDSDGSIKTEDGKVLVSFDYDYGELKAFPGAEGFGKYTTGGRGGKVVEVTNLNDSGKGSLREALLTSGKRTIVFKVAGTIECNSPLKIPNGNGNVTIAGQTAPGDGIAIKGAELRIQSSNVIIRYLRIRPGHTTTGTNEDALRINSHSGTSTQDVIIDHCSLSWGKDEIVEIGGIGSGSNIRNVTVQNSIIGENISDDHKFGLLLWNDAKNITVYGNLFVHNTERNIRSSTCTSNFEMINNLIYGYRDATFATYENQFDVVGNVYKSSPLLKPNSNTIELTATVQNCPNGVKSSTKAYIKGNTYNGSNIGISKEVQPHLVNSKIFDSGVNIKLASTVENSVLNDVGANKPTSDEADIRIINDVKNLTGALLDNISDIGGYPTLNIGESYLDNDKDGMSDEWEFLVGLDSTDPSDGNLDSNNDGYTNLEAFLQYLTQI